MPWPWLMARHCLNMRSGDINQWPFPQQPWEANRMHLIAMQTVWRATQFFSTPASKWTSYDIDYYDWLENDD